MATTSTVPAVKTALVALIAAAVESTVKVSYGRPPSAQNTSRELVYLADVDMDLDIEVSRGGASVRRTRTERYTIDVVVHVAKDRGTVEDVETRAFAIAAHVEDVVADDFTLGLDSLEHATVRGVARVEAGHSEAGWPMCLIVLPVRVVARLT